MDIVNSERLKVLLDMTCGREVEVGAKIRVIC